MGASGSLQGSTRPVPTTNRAICDGSTVSRERAPPSGPAMSTGGEGALTTTVPWPTLLASLAGKGRLCEGYYGIGQVGNYPDL